MELALKADKQAYIPLSFAPGEAFQFDWREDWALIAGVKTKLQVAHTKLSYSRVFAMRAYLQQPHEMLFDVHEHAFALFGGVPERGIYDNMKTAVDKVIRGKLRQVNKRFEAMASHYLFEAQFCNPASGWEKGQVEKAVRDARHSVWQHAPAFDSLDSLNIWLQQRCKQLWFDQVHPEDKQRTLGQCWLEERSHLMPKPVPFDGFIENSKRVSSTCLITFEQHRYSVPASFANRVISLRVYPQRLVVVAEAQVVAEHVRVFTRDHSVQVKRFTTGVIIWPLLSVNRVHCAMGLPSTNYRKASSVCSKYCCDAQAVIGRWWRYWRWCYYTMRGLLNARLSRR